MERILEFVNFIRIQCTGPMKTLEKHITLNLREANVNIRPAKTNGLWCHILIPVTLTLYCCFDNVSTLYKITTCISIGLLFHSILFILFLSTSSLFLKETVYSGCVASGFVSAMLMYVLLQRDLWFSLTVSIMSMWLYTKLLRVFLVKLDKTFTVGEAMVTAQTVVLFFIMSVIKFFFEMKTDDKELEFIGVIVYTILSTVGLIVTALYFLSDSHRTLDTLVYILVAAVIYAVNVLYYTLGAKGFIQIFSYVLLERDRYRLLMFWLVLVSLAVCALLVRTRLAVKASTVTRKTFHVLASMVFLSGIIYDVHLMNLAAGIGLGVIVLVEALRKSGIQPISEALESVFMVYSDEKDIGVLAMTPLYLYVGLAFPLLVVPARAGNEPELLSGVLAIGVGDTAASWFGSRFGFNKWQDSNRTMEGTTFNILSQIGTVYALQLFELLNSENALTRTIFAATVSGLVEAWTDQVDNLLLPLVTMIAFQFTWIVL
ncbi:dolichol kinase [Bicyclus anynana]|uniref:dolichol kinase n=1 Tax=Bicyclus anynana TaxID=110368 RepID=A0A6J1N152_BICAN|nr:dolichol kinase [Bicyclus anynana]